MAAPFLSVDAFTSEFGPLDPGQTLTATRLLQITSDRIRELKPDVDTLRAEQVVFEVVRDIITFGPFEKLSSFQNITSRRTEAGTFDEAMKLVNDYLSDKHKRFLGIQIKAAPRGHFKKCDY